MASVCMEEARGNQLESEKSPAKATALFQGWSRHIRHAHIALQAGLCGATFSRARVWALDSCVYGV